MLAILAFLEDVLDAICHAETEVLVVPAVVILGEKDRFSKLSVFRACRRLHIAFPAVIRVGLSIQFASSVAGRREGAERDVALGDAGDDHSGIVLAESCDVYKVVVCGLCGPAFDYIVEEVMRARAGCSLDKREWLHVC